MTISRQELMNFTSKNTGTMRLAEILVISEELKTHLSENEEDLEKIYSLIRKIMTDQKKIMIDLSDKYTGDN